jgi:hypothetical protein
MPREGTSKAAGGAIGFDWDQALRRSFECAGCRVWVSLSALRDDEGRPRFHVEWTPGPPLRLPPEDIEAFDCGKAKAQAEILAHLSSLEVST